MEPRTLPPVPRSSSSTTSPRSSTRSRGPPLRGLRRRRGHERPRRALRRRGQFEPDLIVLDWMLPDIDGIEVGRRLREPGFKTAILFLTAKDAIENKVEALRAGGDDYVTKPFSLAEIVARVQAILRRTAGDRRATSCARRPRPRRGAPRGIPRRHAVALTATEFALLRFFMLNPRRVLSKGQILQNVWHYDFGGNANVVETYVSYLRRKLDALGPPLIKTVRQAGYMLEAERGEPSAALAARPARARCDRRRGGRARRGGRRDLHGAALVPARPRRQTLDAVHRGVETRSFARQGRGPAARARRRARAVFDSDPGRLHRGRGARTRRHRGQRASAVRRPSSRAPPKLPATIDVPKSRTRPRRPRHVLHRAGDERRAAATACAPRSSRRRTGSLLIAAPLRRQRGRCTGCS